MNDLLTTAIVAHGGWDRWQNLSRATARATIGVAIWGLEGHADAHDVRVTAEMHSQRVEYSPFKAVGTHNVYEPERTAIETDDGRVLDSRVRPRDSFAGHKVTTPWDDLQVVYFRGYAMWTYLTTPFLFREPGFQTQELEPWSIVFPTRRRVYNYGADNRPHLNRTLVSIDFHEITME